MSSWPAARMLTTKPPARCRNSCIAASRAIETPTSGGSSESETSEPTVNPRRSPSRSTVTTATPAGNRRMSAVSASRVAMESESRSVDLVAELAALGQLLLELVRLLLREDVEHRQGRRGAPADVRSDARAHRDCAVHVAGAQEVLSALRGIGMAGLALPRFGQPILVVDPFVRVAALSVMGLDIDNPAVAVLRNAEAVPLQAVDRLALVVVPAEKMLVVDRIRYMRMRRMPVHEEVKLRDRAAPVREPELLRPLVGRSADRPEPHPALGSPVRVVRGLATGHVIRQLGAVVGFAEIRHAQDLLCEVTRRREAHVTHLHLWRPAQGALQMAALGMRQGVQCAPGEHCPLLTVLPEPKEGLQLAVVSDDRDSDVRRAPRDQNRARRARDHDHGDCSGKREQQKVAHKSRPHRAGFSTKTWYRLARFLRLA